MARSIEDEPGGTSRDARIVALYGRADLTDLSELASRAEIEELDLTGCANFSDLAPLARLPKLRKLTLRCCRGISDFRPLARMQSLRVLDLSDCLIADLAPVAEISGLAMLDLWACPNLTDLSPLVALEKLEEIGLVGASPLADVGPSDLAPLGRMPQLRTLDLGYANIEDIGPLANLPCLERLELGLTRVEDISPLKGIVSLVALGRCEGVTTRGLRWDLEDYPLVFSPYGVHNELVRSPATVSVREGDLLLFKGRFVEHHA